jgi:hypothetical protein
MGHQLLQVLKPKNISRKDAKAQRKGARFYCLLSAQGAVGVLLPLQMAETALERIIGQ